MSRAYFSPFPKYLQIRAVLLRRLQNELAPGDRFPTESALCAEFGVSRETIREALVELEEQGLISRGRGSGTKVRRRPELTIEQRLTGLVEDFTELKRDTRTTILATEVCPAQGRIASELSVAAGEPVYLIRRLRFLDGEPLAIHEAYLPVEYGVPLARRDLTHSAVLHELQSYLGEDLLEDFQEADASIADPHFARLLAVPISGALLQIRRRHLDVHGRPVVYFQSWFRSDRYYATVKFPIPANRKAATSASIASGGDLADRQSEDNASKSSAISGSEWFVRTRGVRIGEDSMRSAVLAATRNLNRLASATQRLSVGATPTNYAAEFQALAQARPNK